MRREVERVGYQKLIHLGRVNYKDRWMTSHNTNRYCGLMSAIKYFALTQLHVVRVVGARVGIGLKELPTLRGYTGSVTLLWAPGQSYPQIIECYSPPRMNVVEAFKFTTMAPEMWTQFRCIQILVAEPGSPAASGDDKEPITGSAQRPEGDGSKLSPIPEEASSLDDDEVSHESIEALAVYLANDNQELQDMLESIKESLSLPLEEVDEPESDPDPGSRMPMGYLRLDDAQCFATALVSDDELPNKVELGIPNDVAHAILNQDVEALQFVRNRRNYCIQREAQSSTQQGDIT